MLGRILNKPPLYTFNEIPLRYIFRFNISWEVLKIPKITLEFVTKRNVNIP